MLTPSAVLIEDDGAVVGQAARDVALEQPDRVATVTLNRPDARNALSIALMERIGYNYLEMDASGYVWPIIYLLLRYIRPIRLLQQVGVRPVNEYVQNFGFTKEQLPNNLTLALGSMQATPLDIATGFAVSGLSLDRCTLPEVVITGVSKAFPRQGKDGMLSVLNDVNLTLAEQTFTCLVGPSGCGKSTLLRLAAGGFRDMTRVAAGHPGIWPDICAENRSAIVDALDRHAASAVAA